MSASFLLQLWPLLIGSQSGIDPKMKTDKTEPAQTDTRVSGVKAVIAMFTLAIVATSFLWIYWDMHLMPFMPLLEKLAEEFVQCSQRVDGGRRKTHKGTPMILRVVMRVPFDPTSSAPDVKDEIEARITRTMELAEKYSDLGKYEQLDVHLYNEPKEKEIQQKTFSKEIRKPAD